MTREELDRRFIDLSQYHYVLNQIANGVPTGAAQDMARRVLDGEKSVQPR